eukprot:CAMPEP_0114557822 /NCGR_PEP_ID=MMETSP0114-20121206/10040_1 /TAXON_ID=31324 /ORGANISM="Goniomonas sp, Strain m" /LENGTH=227 /DNA_ID=CAMNT_0001743145 /DNA_START=36 /DNA_END=719 /DNA_ORIENTATION=-
MKQFALLPLIMLMNKVSLDEPEYEERRIALLIAFAIVQLLQFGCMAAIMSKIRSKKDTDVVVVPAQKVMGQTHGTDQEMSVEEYDASKVMEAVKQAVMGGIILGLIVWKVETVKPLFIQVFLTPMTFMDTPLFKVHILGKEATGDLKRPWTPPNPFAGLTGAAEGANATEGSTADAASIEDSPATKSEGKKKSVKKSEQKHVEDKKSSQIPDDEGLRQTHKKPEPVD